MKKRFRLSKNAKNALFVFAIALSAFLAFDPLFENLGQQSGQEFAAAIFGTIFAAVITMVLLNKQTETEEEKDRSDKVFEQKILLYNQAFDTLQSIFEKTEDGQIKISQREVMQIEFLLAKMMMIGSDKTIREFKCFYQTVTNNYSVESGTLSLSPTDRQIMFRFADYCREEFGLSDKNIEKDVLEDIVLQSELFCNMEQVDNLTPETIATVKDIYGYLVFDLNLNNRNIKFIPNGFEAYSSNRHDSENCFLKCFIDQAQVYLILSARHDIKEFQTEMFNGEPVLVLKFSDRKNIEQHFYKIEKAIKGSFDQSKLHWVMNQPVVLN